VDEQPMNERQKAIKSLEKQLTKAARSKEFVDSSGGQYVISYMSELLSGFTNQLLKPSNTRETDIDLKARIDLLRKLKQVLETQANETVLAQITDQLELAKSEE
jgi:hypothetical protein